MRTSSLALLGVSMALGAFAVFGTRAYIASNTVVQAPAPKPVEAHKIVVAAEEIRFGTKIEEGNIRLITWHGEAVPPGAFTSLEDFDGGAPRYARAVIAEGEPLLPQKLTLPGEKPTLSASLEGDMRAVTIRVDDVLGVAGLIAPGDRVDVMLTRITTLSGEDEATVDILLQDIEVLALDQNANENLVGQRNVRTVTLSVAPVMAQKLALAANVGTLSLALRAVSENGHTLAAAQRITLDDLLGNDRRAVVAQPSVGLADLSSAAGLATSIAGAFSVVKDALTNSEVTVQAASSNKDEAEPPQRELEIYHGTERTVYKLAN